MGAGEPLLPVATVPLVLTGLGFGLALAPVNAALLAATADHVHGVSSALLVVARMVGMLVGISALTTIGLRRYYAVQVDLPSPTDVCSSGTQCAAYTRLLTEAGLAQLQTVFVGAAGCAVVAAVLALLLFRARQGRDGHPAGPLVGYVAAVTDAFEDLLAANRRFADTFTLSGFDGIAHAGVAVVTCMDSRIDPLRMLGLQPGDAKIFRNPGGRVTPQALEALVLGVHLLNVHRILVDPAHPVRDGVLDPGGAARARRRVRRPGRLVADVRRGDGPGGGARGRRPGRPLAPARPDEVEVGGFLYNVDTGLLDRRV